MPNEVPTILGAILEPEPAGMPSVEPLLGATGELPYQYIVPSWRECFDDQFHVIPDKIRPKILNQGPIDSCVGHGTSVQKSAQEGVVISPRDIWRQAKRLDGYPLEQFGTTLSAAQDALAQTGAAEDPLVSRDPAMGRDAYISLADVTDPIKANRTIHRSKNSYFVPRTLIKETIFTYGFPLVTSSPWYPADSLIGAGGIMHFPTENTYQGHCFACIGWVLRMVEDKLCTCYVMVNSFGPNWGDNGIFYVPINGTENRLQNALVSVDKQPSLVSLLLQYNGRNVKEMGKPDHWKIENGLRRRYPNEIVFWLNGGLFGYDVYDIDPDDLLIIPQGPDMNIDNVSWQEKERFRQMEQHIAPKP